MCTDVFRSYEHPRNRRTIAKGMAWAVPAVLTSAVVPAFAASRCEGVAGPSFAQLERWSIANPVSGELGSSALNGVEIIGGQEYWMSRSTALGDDKAIIILSTSYRAGYNSESHMRPGCRYFFRYSVAAQESAHSNRKGKGDVKLEVFLYAPDGNPVRHSEHIFTTKPKQDTNKTTSVPLGGQVFAPNVQFTAQEGTYRLEIIITVAAEETRREKVVARGIGVTSPYFEFAG